MTLIRIRSIAALLAGLAVVALVASALVESSTHRLILQGFAAAGVAVAPPRG